MKGVRTLSTLAVLGLLAFQAAPAAAQQTGERFELTVQNIMRGPELVGSSPRGVRFTDDGRWVYFRWKPGGLDWDEDASLYRVPADGGEPERLSDEQADSLGVLLAGGDLSPDERRRVVAYRGDLYVIDRASLDVRRLTSTRANESSPVFGAEGRTIYFVRDDNVFAHSLADGSVRQLTDIRRGGPQQESDAEGHRKFLEEQQEELFEHVRRDAEEREERERRREARHADEPETVHLRRDERVRQLAVDPGGGYAVLVVSKPAAGDLQTIVPDYVTASGYTEDIDARPKVGDAQDDARVGLLDLGTGAVRWLELVPDEDSPAAAGGPEQYRDRLARVRFLGWAPDAGPRGLIAAVGYAYKDQWLYTLDADAIAALAPDTAAADTADAEGDARTGEEAEGDDPAAALADAATLIAHDHDEAWIGGPCSTWTGGCAGWMPDGRSVWLLSERDGHSHLYTVAATGGEPRQLTRGDWAVTDVEIAPDEDAFHLATREESPFELHFYRMPLDGGERTRITDGTGRHDVAVSPDGERLAVTHSAANRPPELYLMDNRPGAGMERVTSSPTDEWLGFGWIRPEIVWFDARDGERVPARIYRPADLGAQPNGAGVIFVHGAGYLHNVHRWWSSYYREYMFHHVLAARGYTVLDIDYRGSRGYGRDWRTAIYRHMGGKDLTDQVDGARYLAEHEDVDPDRIGIYGGSYGGFITLMALFRHPDAFGAGAALRSVTDWAHYNHWYTSRILNLPQGDDEAYGRSSPIYFAEGLDDPLLIAHGMVDTNVHFQDVVRLAQRLIELGKTDWEMAVYPVEGHGFSEPASWTDEYRRILELFERAIGSPRTASEEEG